MATPEATPVETPAAEPMAAKLMTPAPTPAVTPAAAAPKLTAKPTLKPTLKPKLTPKAPAMPAAVPATPPAEGSADSTPAPAEPLTPAAPAAAPAAVRPTLKPKLKPGAPVTGHLKPVTIQPAQASDAPAPADPKKATSRVDLGDARTGTAETGALDAGPKTIRIKPAKLGQPAATPAGAGAAPDPKRQTSRISLESALAGTDSASSADTDSGPKTIRLKRPSQTPSVKVDAGALNKTAQIDTDAVAPTPTQKRTIKVKRPTGGKRGPKVKVGARGGAAAAVGSPAAAVPVAPTPPTDGAHWSFITFSIIGLLLTAGAIYVLASQAVGPNHSLTQLSSYKQGPDLPVKGKRVRQVQY